MDQPTMKKMTTFKFPKKAVERPPLHKLIHDLPQEEYHAITNTYSSSQLKDLQEDQELFVKKHIEKTIPKENIQAFDVGSYFHTGLLEPEKIKKDCVVYPKKVRRGKDWESFKSKHKNKTIVSVSQKDQAERLIESVQDSPISMGFIERGKPELSVFIGIVVWNGNIFAPAFEKVLTRSGWRDAVKPGKKDGTWIVVKARADCLGDDFILDLKSTTGNARSEQAMAGKITYYSYDLSAALYLDLFSLVLEKDLRKFIWTFASKDCFNSRSHQASPNNILIGRIKYMKALLALADLIKNKWAVYDSLGTLEPTVSELYHLQESDSDSDLL